MRILILALLLLPLLSCGDGDTEDNRICVVDIEPQCSSGDATLDDEVETAGLSCDAVGEDIAICGNTVDIDAAISTAGLLGDTLARGRQVNPDSDSIDQLEDN